MKKIYATVAVALATIHFSYAQWTGGPTGPVYYSGGNVGIGTTAPSFALHVFNNDTPLGLTNSLLTAGNTSGETSIYFGDVSSGVNMLRASKRSFNTRAFEIWTEYGFGVPSKGADFFHNYINLYTADVNRLTIDINGNVGIGTTSPSYKLDINGSIHTVGTSELGSGYLHVSTDQHFDSGANYTFRDGVGINNPNGSSYVSGTSVMSIGAMSNGISLITTGNIGIGTTDTKGYMLAVNGSAIATSMKVALYGSWPDYVLKPSYRLPSLLTVKAYIDQNQHLPEMPSEQEVKDSGIDLGEMVKLQTKKIEELTLYIIDKDKQLTEQEARIAALEKALLKQPRKHSK